MSLIEMSVQIDGKLSDVFEFLSDPTNDSKWRSEVKQVVLKAGSPRQVGATYEEAISVLAMKMNATLEIVGIEPGHRIDFHGSSGPMSMATAYIFEAAGAGTKVTIQINTGPAGKVMEPTMRKQMRAGLSRLKALLES